MNENDSGMISSFFYNNGWEKAETIEQSNFVIFNTCAVRQKAESRALQNIANMKHLFLKKEGRKLAVIGCAAQNKKGDIKKIIPFVDYVIGPDQYRKFSEILQNDRKNGVFVDENQGENYENFALPETDNGILAKVTIMRGCNNFCSYCVVPYARGREKSRKSVDIINEIKQLTQNGVKEVMLLGQNVNSYIDGDVGFSSLLEEVSAIDSLERVRFLTSHPRDFNEELVRVIAKNNKVCNWIHLPLQAGSDRVLKLMNRGYTLKEYMQKIEVLRKYIPDAVVSTDIIVGFPTETEEDFNKTLETIKEIEYDSAFMFIYSVREGTKAADDYKDDVEYSIKTERLNRLVGVQMDITQKKSAMQVGKTKRVLFDRFQDGILTGRGEDNRVVQVESSVDYTGLMKEVYIEGSTTWSLKGILKHE